MKVGDLVKTCHEYKNQRPGHGIIIEDAGHTKGRSPSFKTYLVQWNDRGPEWWDSFQLELTSESR
tara:strand:- start:83 stop:277 length:195 start_codon:yes stop_codon:yes gene_type:complete